MSTNPSWLCPNCRAEEHIFLWRGINTPPVSMIGNSTIHLIASLALCASLWDSSSYGSGIHKFHLFCDIFTIPEVECLPASFELLHSFALWAAADPATLGPELFPSTQFKPVSVAVVRKYLAAIRTWHLAQGWPPPLNEDDHTRINWSLRGLKNMQGSHKRPVRPPITIGMLQAMCRTLDLDNPLEACIWAMVTCAFWGMMHFSKVSVSSHTAFNKTKHLKQHDVFFSLDLDGKHYAWLDHPSTKTGKPGEIQSVFLVPQSDLCLLKALQNLT